MALPNGEINGIDVITLVISQRKLNILMTFIVNKKGECYLISAKLLIKQMLKFSKFE